jgi:hypothetical protein
MMKTRLMKKGRPRLVPPKNYQESNVDPWLDDKESDITSVSSGTTDETPDSGDEESISEDDADGQEDDDTDDDDDDDDDEDENGSRMERTLDQSPSEQSEVTKIVINETTPLFKAIEGEEWDSVVAFLQTGSWGWKWSSLCAQLYQVEEKPAAKQVRTWVVSAKEGKGEIRRLPLHAAIAHGAPIAVVDLLVKSYDKAVKNPDSEGNYPLHLAFQTGASMDTLVMLMKGFPEAVHMKNGEEKLPTESGAAKNLCELLQLSIGATKTHMEVELTKEKGNLEEDRKQLLEVTKELMNLKKMVAERERNMTKDNFLYQKQHLSSAISQLTRLKTDLDQHEESVLKHHLVAEKKRMDGVLGELNKTKGELDKIKSEQHLTPTEGDISQPMPSNLASSSMPTPPKKKRPKKSKIVTNRHAYLSEEEAEREGTEKHDFLVEATSGAVDEAGTWDDPLIIDTTHLEMGDSAIGTPKSYDRSGSQSPRKLKNVAARFKKKMNWRKLEKQTPETE